MSYLGELWGADIVAAPVPYSMTVNHYGSAEFVPIYCRFLVREKAQLLSVDRAWATWRISRVNWLWIHCNKYIVLCTASSSMTELNLLAEATE